MSDSIVFGPVPKEPTPEEIDKLNREHPSDVITGYPYHYIVNGDHEGYTEEDGTVFGCPCGGHTPECQVWGIPTWKHAPTICNIKRTRCDHPERHTYGQPCDAYHEPAI